MIQPFEDKLVSGIELDAGLPVDTVGAQFLQPRVSVMFWQINWESGFFSSLPRVHSHAKWHDKGTEKLSNCTHRTKLAFWFGAITTTFARPADFTLFE